MSDDVETVCHSPSGFAFDYQTRCACCEQSMSARDQILHRE